MRRHHAALRKRIRVAGQGHFGKNDRPRAQTGSGVGAGYVRLNYLHRSGVSEWTAEAHPVTLDSTPCHFDGEPICFRSPDLGCGRRVTLFDGGAVFACRRCHDPDHPSQRRTLAVAQLDGPTSFARK